MQKILSIFKKIIIIIVLIGVAVMAYLYWGTYEDGFWAGKVLSVSRKGVIFKTYEGKISMESFGSLKGVSPIAESRDFSVEKSEPEIIKILEQVALTGERVNLVYKRRYLRFAWRGDTKYFVVKVERLESK
jgi:hypothetical protein